MNHAETFMKLIKGTSQQDTSIIRELETVEDGKKKTYRRRKLKRLATGVDHYFWIFILCYINMIKAKNHLKSFYKVKISDEDWLSFDRKPSPLQLVIFTFNLLLEFSPWNDCSLLWVFNNIDCVISQIIVYFFLLHIFLHTIQLLSPLVENDRVFLFLGEDVLQVPISVTFKVTHHYFLVFLASFESLPWAFSKDFVVSFSWATQHSLCHLSVS